MDELLNVRDVANILGLKVSTIYKLSMSKKLPIVKINGSLRFRQDQIQAFIEKHSASPIETRT